MSDGALPRIARALRSLAVPPGDTPWNHDELGDLVPPVLREAAVLVGLVERPGGTQMVFTRRTDHLRHHAGQVSFPGGRIEPDDPSPAAAALREAREEVGLQAAQARLLGYLDPLLTITGFRVLPTVVLVDPAFRPEPEPGEVAEVFEVPLDLLMDPGQLETITLQFGGRTRHVFQYRYQPQRIWGATASILYNLRERLAGSNQWRV